MQDDRTTILTKRGQTSVPASIRRQGRLKPGQKLHWHPVSDTEFRVTVPPLPEAPGPLAMLGWAHQFNPDDSRTTDQLMRELREGEED